MAWLKAAFENTSDTERLLAESVQARIKSANFTEKDVEYINSFKLNLLDKTLNLPDRQLELLRLVAKRFDVQQKSNSFTSHRPFIGPIIVAVKRALAPFVRALLGDTIRQQREFNAAVVDLLVEMGKERK